MGRRSFLAGLGGVLVALPVLESIQPRRAWATGMPPFFITFAGTNGVQQRPRFGGPHGNEPEGFWPGIDLPPSRSVGLATNDLPQIVDGDDLADRALHELRGLESDIAIVRGLRFNEIDQGHHETRRAQLLTGSTFNFERPDRHVNEHENAWGRHESFDTRLSRELEGGAPVLLGKNAGTYQISFEERNGLVESSRGLENPMTLYDQFFRVTTNTSGSAAARNTLATDLVARQLTELRRDPMLSSADRVRLDRHFEYLRAVEREMVCGAPDIASDQLRNLRLSQTTRPAFNDDGNPAGETWEYSDRHYPEATTNAFLELLALGAACGSFRAATLVVDGFLFEHTDVFPEGPERDHGFPTWFHNISHRTLSSMNGVDKWSGAGVREHHRIDRWYARRFRFLIERLRESGALDRGVCMFTNEVTTGAHEATDIPLVLAGSCNGALRMGQYVDLQSGSMREGQVPNNRLFNTLGAAMGLRSGDGQPLHDFGGIRPDGSRDEGGVISALMA